MPMAFQTSSNAIFSFKVMLISTTVLSAAMMLKFSVPAIMDFAVYEVPSIYNCVVSWLRPPYLYLLINCIIITIVASSKFQSRKDEYESSPPRMQGTVNGVLPQQAAPMLGKSVQGEFSMAMDGKGIQTEYSTAAYAYNGVLESGSGVEVQKRLDFDAFERVDPQEGRKTEQSPLTVNAADRGVPFVEDAMSNKENEYVIGKSAWNGTENGYVTAEHSPLTVKPPVSARFVHRRNFKASPEGVGKTTVLGVSKPKRNDTLESTWKTITDGRAIPLTRHLRKSDTWERGDGNVRQQEKKMSKAATFNTAGNGNGGSPSPGGSGKARREASLSQDELNRRVEAFIKKFNEDMRLQRQESLNHYREMINHGRAN